MTQVQITNGPVYEMIQDKLTGLHATTWDYLEIEILGRRKGTTAREQHAYVVQTKNGGETFLISRSQFRLL